MAISVLQEGQNTTGATPAASVSVTLTGVTAGSFIHVIGTIGFIGRTVVFSDSNSDTPTVLGSAGDTTDVQTVSHAWFGPVAAGNITFTVAPSTLTTSFNGIWVREIGQCSGVQASSNITVSAATTAATVSTQPALWSGFGENFAGGTTPTATTGTQDASGWTFGGGTGICRTSHARVTATGSVSATYTSASGALIAIFTESAGGGVTENLTAQTSTFTEGTIARAIGTALTGQTATFSEGTISAAAAYGLTGQTATFTEGALTPALAKALTGQTATFSLGTITPSISYGLTGQSASFTEGTITPSQGAVANLTAQTATFSVGTITPAITYALPGQTATFTEGLLSPQNSYGLTGQTSTFTEGALSGEVDYALTGLTATFAEGTITAQAGGDVTQSLTGLSASFSVGVITVTGGDVITPSQLPAGRSKRRRLQERFIVRIDGQEFVCSTLEGAREVLRQAAALAKQHALALVERQVLAQKPLTVTAPKIIGSIEIRKDLEATRIEVGRIYTDVFRDAEIGMLMELSARREDEDVLWMLM